ncbi:MAG TPA: TonB-dependent receptor [Blastocatellia bacterium]|nr:TonB-dependent receptor [Blastocatellia bacterium]
MIGNLLPVGLLLAALAFVAIPGQAQVLYGSITGNITDSGGAAVPGATVTITHKETGQSREGVTDASGSYDFPTVLAGTYSVRVSKAGFKTITKDNVTVTLNNVTRADISIEVGQVTESVIITAEAAQLKTDRAEVSAELTSRPLRDLPVPLGRNYQNLFKTLPGFTPPEEAHSVPTNPSRSMVFNVNGASRSSNNTRIDGISSTNIWLPHITAYVPALEAIETVNVVSNSFDAEQGLAGGAAINVQIKSGTNDFHGAAFEYHSNQHLKARDYFRPPTNPKGKFIQNQYGGTLGGPIIRNKLFFFGSYEGTRNRQNDSLIVSVPTANIRNGDFRNLVDGSGRPVNIYDPLTGNADGTGRQIISCNGVQNVICPDRINASVKKILPLIPQANLPGETNNYFASAGFLFDRWTVDSKVNWNVSSKFNMFGRYSVLNFFTVNETVFGKALQGRAINSSNPGTGQGKTHSFSVGGVYTFSSSFIVDANFGFFRQNTDVAQSDINEKRGLDFLGIPGTNGSRPFEGGFPFFDLETYADYGTVDTFMPYTRRDDQYQIVTNANWLRGPHNIRFGMDIYRQKLNHTQPESSDTSFGARGGFHFGTGTTSLKGGTNGNQFNSFAAFLLGLPDRIGKLTLTEAPYSTRNWQYSFYGRDQWQVTKNLTFSFGTRWEYFPIPTRADRGLERYNPTTNKIEIGGVGTVPEDLGVKVSKGLFAPRVGLAYRIRPTFVVRAGYGITNDPYALARPLRTNYPILLNLNNEASTGVNGFLFVSRLEQGIPAAVAPDLGNGIISIPGNVSAITLPDKFDRGYIQSWNLSLQKELKWGFTGEVAYIGTRQIRQLGFRELNYANIGGGNSGRQLAQKFGRTASTLLVTPIGNSHYDGMQARLERRFRDFYQLNVNYTWSKSITTSGANNSDDTLRINIPQYYYLNRSLSGFDRPHNLQITNITELPFGKGRKYLNDRGILSAIVGGWQVNSILSFFSGLPFTVTSSGSTLNAPGNSQTADLIKPKVEVFGNNGPGQKYFDVTAFRAVGSDPDPNNRARFGTSGFNILRGPHRSQWDFGLFRQFRITEKFNLQFRAEAFNFTNTPQWGNPNSNRDSSTFGENTSVSGERIFRFGLRLGF